jgi:DNA-binding GntR family transcriptional regulator
MAMKNVHADRAYVFIRRMILSGEYAPGRRLKTQELTAKIGVSGTPVRDALRLLEREGLVVMEPRVGASVKSLTLLEFKELCEVRCALECLAAELAATNRSDTELAEIEAAFIQMGNVIEKLKTEETEDLINALRQQDIRFHLGILVAAHNETLYKEVLRMQAVHRILARITPADPSFSWRISVHEAHRDILEAIKKQNDESARRSMKTHIQGIVDRAVLAMAKSERRRQFEHATVDAGSYLE